MEFNQFDLRQDMAEPEKEKLNVEDNSYQEADGFEAVSECSDSDGADNCKYKIGFETVSESSESDGADNYKHKTGFGSDENSECSDSNDADNCDAKTVFDSDESSECSDSDDGGYYYVKTGFDTNGISSEPEDGGIVRVPLVEGTRGFAVVRKYSQPAIDKYNAKNGTKYEFVKVTKANCQCVKGRLYYVTIEAKAADSDADAETFQALMYHNTVERKEVEVSFCRLKRKN